jgi:hypothetical protein
VARPREAVGCRTLICRKADSGQLNLWRQTSQVPLYVCCAPYATIRALASWDQQW